MKERKPRDEEEEAGEPVRSKGASGPWRGTRSSLQAQESDEEAKEAVVRERALPKETFATRSRRPWRSRQQPAAFPTFDASHMILR